MRLSVSSVIQSIQHRKFKIAQLLLSAIVLALFASSIIQSPAVEASDWGSVPNAGVYRFKVGSFKVATISDGLLKLPPLPIYAPTADPKRHLQKSEKWAG
jgi:hypothetical protein